MKWGDLSFANDPLADFFGIFPTSDKKQKKYWVANMMRRKLTTRRFNISH
jgi:hypothetical protein